MRLSLDRLWLVIAIGLPVLVALLVPMPAVDLAYQVRAGDEILRTATLPGVRHLDVHGRGHHLDRPAVAGAGPAEPRLSGRAAGSCSRWSVRGSSGVTLGLTLATSMARGAGHRTAAVLALLAFALAAPALALRPQLFGIAIFAALLFLVATR